MDYYFINNELDTIFNVFVFSGTFSMSFLYYGIECKNLTALIYIIIVSQMCFYYKILIWNVNVYYVSVSITIFILIMAKYE